MTPWLNRLLERSRPALSEFAIREQADRPVEVVGSGIKAFLKSKYAGALFIAAAVVGLFAPTLYDTVATAPLVLAAKYLGIPIICLCFYAFLINGASIRSISGWIMSAVFALAFSVLLVVVSGGYLILANAWGPGQRETQVQGRITRLSVSGHKVRRYEVSIVDATGRRSTLDVGWAEYDQLSVGETYSARWKIGSLGMLYK